MAKAMTLAAKLNNRDDLVLLASPPGNVPMKSHEHNISNRNNDENAELTWGNTMTKEHSHVDVHQRRHMFQRGF